MDCPFFASAAIAFLLLGVIPGGVSTADDDGIEIAYGSVIKLMHERTKFRLYSHDVLYGSGSGQQSVTGSPDVDDANSYWIVKPQLDSPAKQGDAIPNGSIIRLQHMTTRRWLHSHVYASPISGNLEVSCFGGDDESNTGDHWQLELRLMGHGNGTREPGSDISIQGVICTVTNIDIKGVLRGSRRSVVLKRNALIMSGWQLKESTFLLIETNETFYSAKSIIQTAFGVKFWNFLQYYLSIICFRHFPWLVILEIFGLFDDQ